MKISAALLTTLLAFSVGCAPAAVDLAEPGARGSYAQGYVIGEQGQGLPLDVEAFVAGVRAGLSGQGEMDPQELIWDESGWRLRACPGS